MMKKMRTAALLIALLCALSGCTAMDEALAKIGGDIEAMQMGESTSASAAGDWGFVVTLRERATALFTEAFPDATVSDAAVATKSAAGDRVIVTLTYQLNGKTGKYGFDYEKSEQGEYTLTRYGEGVDSSNL